MGQFFGRGVETPLRTRLLIATAVAAVAGLPLSANAAPPSCKSITKGTLDVELPAGQRSSRMVRLAEGETVNFSIHSGASGATVTLVSGTGAPQTLMAANSGGMASYCAPATATYVFVIEAGRDNLTSVSANCTLAGATGQPESATARTEVDLVQIETDAEGLSRRSAFSLGLSEFAASTKTADTPIHQWTGDNAILTSTVDTAGTDDDAASSAALSFSANAEIGPDDLAGVLARMERVSGADGAVDTETQTAMAWSAILAPGLSFAPAPQQTASAAKRFGRKATQVASMDATPAVEEWWVTHLQDNREAEAPATETAVLRRDAVASNTFSTPPMALGGFIPPADVLPATQPVR
jgi:hypothetical protein